MVQKDGITWLASRGTAPSFSKLEDNLSDVKTLFKAKFVENADDDKEEESEQEVQKDGITWLVSRRSRRLRTVSSR